MNIQIKKKVIKEKIDEIDDERELRAIAQILNLHQDDDTVWHQQLLQERFEEYQKNPENVITLEELKKKWKGAR